MLLLKNIVVIEPCKQMNIVMMETMMIMIDVLHRVRLNDVPCAKRITIMQMLT